MLSRTADCLFWMGRYTERAANVARGLHVGWRMAGLGAEDDAEEWRRLLVAAGCEPGFAARHGAVTAERAVDYLVRDRDNASGLLSCIGAARANARQVRTALTVDMWSALSDTWNGMRNIAEDEFQGEKLPGFADWVRERVLLFNGAAQDTMLRGEAFLFLQLGTALERADNTARLLDVRHDALAGALADGPAGTVEYAQWQAILLSVSALRAYHWIFRDQLCPVRIAELLVMRPELPRSLVACHSRVSEVLDAIAAGQGGRRGPPHLAARAITDELRGGDIRRVLEGGLHDFLTSTIERTAGLGASIAAFYIRGEWEAAA